MTEVTRYDLTQDIETGQYDITPVPASDQGTFVTYDDYLAERQRAGDLKKQLELEQHHRKTLSGTVDIVDGQRDHWMERARKAEAELAALRGAQEPDHYHLNTPATGAVVYYPASQKEIVKTIKDDLEGDVVVTELFAHPPKPVVVLTSPVLVYDTAEDTYGEDGCLMIPYESAKESIEAAGIVVKDGE